MVPEERMASGLELREAAMGAAGLRAVGAAQAAGASEMAGSVSQRPESADELRLVLDRLLPPTPTRRRALPAFLSPGGAAQLSPAACLRALVLARPGLFRRERFTGDMFVEAAKRLRAHILEHNNIRPDALEMRFSGSLAGGRILDREAGLFFLYSLAEVLCRGMNRIGKLKRGFLFLQLVERPDALVYTIEDRGKKYGWDSLLKGLKCEPKKGRSARSLRDLALAAVSRGGRFIRVSGEIRELRIVLPVRRQGVAE